MDPQACRDPRLVSSRAAQAWEPKTQTRGDSGCRGALEELACKALDQDAECLGYKGRRGQVSFFLGSWGRVWEPWPLKSIC